MGAPCFYSTASGIVRGIRCESCADGRLQKTTAQGYKWFISAWAEQWERPGGERVSISTGSFVMGFGTP